VNESDLNTHYKPIGEFQTHMI